MHYCPRCRTEYEPTVASCADCDVPLVASLPPEDLGKDPVVAFRAASDGEARIVAATLQAEGIPAYVMPQDVYLPVHELGESAPHRIVLVPADAAEQAAAVLAEPAMDLAALEEAEIAGAEAPGEIAEYDRDLTDEETVSEGADT